MKRRHHAACWSDDKHARIESVLEDDVPLRSFRQGQAQPEVVPDGLDATALELRNGGARPSWWATCVPIGT
jgi:hypothetical protein